MSMLDDLRQQDEDGHPATVAYNEALDDVREALRNPTDEQVKAIVAATCPPWAQSELEADLIRVVLAAAAGGEQ